MSAIKSCPEILCPCFAYSMMTSLNLSSVLPKHYRDHFHCLELLGKQEKVKREAYNLETTVLQEVPVPLLVFTPAVFFLRF